MRSLKYFVFSTLFFIQIVSAQPVVIKSLKAYTNSKTDIPILFHHKKLNIEFDVQSDFEPNLVIVFRFCDKNWIPYNNSYLRNQGMNVEYHLGFQRLPFTVLEAKYHYQGYFPNQNNYVSFPFDGKWRYYITDFQDTSKIYANGKFFVVDTLVSLTVSKKNEVFEGKNYFPYTLNRVFNIETDFSLSQNLIPANVEDVEIIENHKIAYPVIIDRGFNTNTRQYYWDANRGFRFIARDLRPGNGYRETDFRNSNVFNTKNINAQIDGIEYSRFFQFGDHDLDGGSIYLNYDNEYATYLNVSFLFKPPNNDYDNIYIVGSFNNWKVLPNYKMKKNGDLFSLPISLKRGVYDYQYVTADVSRNQISNIDWYVFEGNFYETSNIYHIFLFYKDDNYGGYDRIIGYYQLKTK